MIMGKQIGRLITGDLIDNTMTFQMEEDVVLRAGRYEIVPIKDCGNCKHQKESKYLYSCHGCRDNEGHDNHEFK